MQIRPSDDMEEPAVIVLWNEERGDAAPHNVPATVIRRKLAIDCDLFLVAVIRPILIICIALSFATSLKADDATVAAALKSKGAEIAETKGVVTGVSFRDCTGLTASDYGQLRQLSRLKTLSLGKGANDASLKAIGTLSELELFSSNGLDVTDDSIRTLAAWQKLKTDGPVSSRQIVYGMHGQPTNVFSIRRSTISARSSSSLRERSLSVSVAS